MGSSSMQYTIGSAIERARQDGRFVELLVDNHWLDGFVVECDGHGVVMENEGRDHCVVRLEHVSAVRVSADAQGLNGVTSDDELVDDVVSALPAPALYRHAAAG